MMNRNERIDIIRQIIENMEIDRCVEHNHYILDELLKTLYGDDNETKNY